MHTYYQGIFRGSVFISGTTQLNQAYQFDCLTSFLRNMKNCLKKRVRVFLRQPSRRDFVIIYDESCFINIRPTRPLSRFPSGILTIDFAIRVKSNDSHKWIISGMG